MANWSLPTLSSLYADFRRYLSDRMDDSARMFNSATVTATNLPTGTVRWNASASKFEIWSGSAWGDLAASYGISITGSAATCTGLAASATTALVCTGNAATASACTGNAATASSCTGNAATATTAAACSGNAATATTCTGNAATASSCSGTAANANALGGVAAGSLSVNYANSCNYANSAGSAGSAPYSYVWVAGVGCYYASPANPGAVYGGSWEQCGQSGYWWQSFGGATTWYNWHRYA